MPRQTNRFCFNKSLLFVAKLLSASNHKSKLLWLLILFIISIFTFNIDDQEAILLYTNKLQELSPHKILKAQKDWIQLFYINNTHREPLKQERHKVRKDFNKKKKQLLHQWEASYKLKWPQVKITKQSVPATINYEAHHIIPINSGGVNYVWNITPLSSESHKLLHQSLEEKACFSHDFLHLKFIRFVLRIREVFFFYFRPYINKTGTNYAKG